MQLQSSMSADQQEPARWNLARRLSFRLTFCYLLLYLFPFPLSAIPGLASLTAPYNKAWQSIVPWVGTHVLRLDQAISVLPNGSGDTTFNYVQVLCYALLAAVAAAVWSILDWRRPSYPTLYDWLRIYVRFALGMTMLGYGFAKVFPVQFPPPDVDRLLQPYGNSSPMGLLWTFMGASRPYTIFAGATEVLGGLLLFFRRTTTFGTLVVVAVMTNIVMMNLCYDVPVKQYSLHLLLMALFLLLPDLGRLANVLVLNRPAQSVYLGQPFRPIWANRLALIAKGIFVCWVIGTTVWTAYSAYPRHTGNTTEPAVLGGFQVDTMVLDGEQLPPIAEDSRRWRVVVFNRYGRMSILAMDGSRQRFACVDDPAARSLTLSDWFAQKEVGRLKYVASQPDLLELEGELQGKTVQATLKRLPRNSFLLTSRGFHWINEYPFNQ